MVRAHAVGSQWAVSVGRRPLVGRDATPIAYPIEGFKGVDAVPRCHSDGPRALPPLSLRRTPARRVRAAP